jgi:hypothetical protein
MKFNILALAASAIFLPSIVTLALPIKTGIARQPFQVRQPSVLDPLAGILDRADSPPASSTLAQEFASFRGKDDPPPVNRREPQVSVSSLTQILSARDTRSDGKRDVIQEPEVSSLNGDQGSGKSKAVDGKRQIPNSLLAWFGKGAPGEFKWDETHGNNGERKREFNQGTENPGAHTYTDNNFPAVEKRGPVSDLEALLHSRLWV